MAHVSTRSPFIFDPLPFGFGGLRQRESPPMGPRWLRRTDAVELAVLGAALRHKDPQPVMVGCSKAGAWKRARGRNTLCVQHASSIMYYIYIYTHTFVDDLCLKTSGIF